MFAEDISEDFSDLTLTGFYSFSGYLRNLRGRLLSSEKFSEVFTLWVFTLKLRSHGGGTEPKNPWIPEIRKNYEKNTKSPTPGRLPKIRKNYRKNTKMAEKLPFLYFFGIFFRIFGGATWGRGFCNLYFFRNFFVFPGFRGFWALYHPRGIVIQNNIFTKQIHSHVLLQTWTNQWQQHYKENVLVEFFL